MDYNEQLRYLLIPITQLKFYLCINLNFNEEKKILFLTNEKNKYGMRLLIYT